VLLLEAGGADDRHPLVRIPLGVGKLYEHEMFDWGLSSEPEPNLHGRTLEAMRGTEETIDVGGTTAKVLYLGRAHTGGDLAATALSVQGFLTFLMGFGWGGLGGYRGSELSLGLSAVIGIGCGIVLLLVVVFLLRATRRLQSSGNITLGDLVGLEAEVYTTIPASGQGRGQIVTVVGDRQRFVNAVSDAAEIPPRTRIAVVRVNGDNSVTVRRIDAQTT
jgi:hypothetical protein